MPHNAVETARVAEACARDPPSGDAIESAPSENGASGSSSAVAAAAAAAGHSSAGLARATRRGTAAARLCACTAPAGDKSNSTAAIRRIELDMEVNAASVRVGQLAERS